VIVNLIVNLLNWPVVNLLGWDWEDPPMTRNEGRMSE